jgi:hypothetical protein
METASRWHRRQHERLLLHVEERVSKLDMARCRKKGLEAATGVEPVMEVLQTSGGAGRW